MNRTVLPAEMILHGEMASRYGVEALAVLLMSREAWGCCLCYCGRKLPTYGGASWRMEELLNGHIAATALNDYQVETVSKPRGEFRGLWMR